MPLTIKPQLKGASLSRSGGRIPYLVRGLEGTTPAVMWAALHAGGLPQPDQPHPEVPGLIVTDAEVSEMLGNFDCIVTVTYGKSNTTPPGGGTDEGGIEIDTNVVGVRTELDYGGNPITVIYNPQNIGPHDANRSANTAGGDRVCGADVDQFIAMAVIRVTRKEDSHPLTKAMKYVGRLNSGQFALNDDVEAWLCTRLAGSRSLTSDKYDVTYEFSAPEDGWHRVAAYIEPTTGRPPGAPPMGTLTINANRPRVRMQNGINQDHSLNGLTIVRVQGSADFNALNLPSL